MLKSLLLQNFRNFEKVKIDFTDLPKVIVLTGANAQGKTNLLEAIYLLSIAKSFRTHRSLDLIQFSKNYSFITGEIRTNKLEIFLENSAGKKKALKINEINKSAQEFVGNFPIVLFTPQDLNLISFSPNLRRRFLNILNSQLDPDYLRNLIEYKKILKRRNALLATQDNCRHDKNNNLEAQLFFWDKELVKTGACLILKRQETIDYFNGCLNQYYNQIAERDETLSLQYKNTVPSGKTLKETEEIFYQELQKKRKKDLQYRTTTIGPHRDDFSFILNDFEAPEFCSRGEERSIILALKIAEIELLKNKKGFSPLLLLDDVFSELDQKRKRKLLKIIVNYQTIITTTHEEVFEDLEEIKFKKYEVKEGKIN